MQHDETDCGAACIASVAKYYGKKVSINRIRFYAGTDAMGTSGLGIVKGAENLGMSCRGMMSENHELSEDIPFPVICHVKKDVIDHYVIVYGVRRNKVIVADPADGVKKMALEDFKKIWTGIFFVVLPEQRFQRTKETKGLFQRFLYLIVPYKKTIIECFIAGLLLSLLGAASAFYFRFLIDDVLYSQLKNTLTLCSLAYLVVVIFQVLTEFSRNQLMNVMSNKIDMVLICDYFRHILHLPMNFFTSRKTGEIISRIGDTQTIRHTVSSTTLSVVIDACMLVVGGFFLFMFGSRLLVVAIIPVVFSTIIVWLFIKPFQTSLKEMAVMEADKQSSLVESVNGIATIKALSSEQSAFSRAESKIVNCVRKSMRLGTMSNVQNSLQHLISSLGTLALYWSGSFMIFNGSLSLGQLISFVTLSGYFLGPLARLLTLQQSLQEALIASDRLGEILDMNEEAEEEKNLVEFEKIKGKIEVKNLSFSYKEKLILSNASFCIKDATITSFYSPSGSGKSTIAKLLTGILLPSSGEIFLDGKLLSSKNHYDRKNGLKIQMVYQNPTSSFDSEQKLISSIIELIKYHKLCTKEQRSEYIKEFATSLNIDQDILNHLPTQISGGEAQRIALMKALMLKPKVLILDEATSMLDVSTQANVIALAKRKINELGGSILLITHDKALSECLSDQIYTIKQNKIEEYK